MTATTVELRRDRLVPSLLIAAFVAILVRTAWISDDAYITFRTVDNFLHGFGLRWNVAERVQSYTHPLWMLSIAAAQSVTGEPYFTTLALSALFTVIALIAIVWHAESPAAAIVGLALLVGSRAFVDYSTSGLENPLTHALLAWFWWVCWRHPDRAGLLGIALSLILLNRMDCVLLVAPAVAFVLVQRGSIPWAARFAAGLIPFAAWEIFSIIYYGVPFPNTAYAKLAGAAMSRRELAWQGVVYLGDSLGRDPLTLGTIVAVVIWIAVRPTRHWPLAAGLVLYLLYIVRIGGDFMTGRFLTAPFLVAVLFLVDRGLPRWMSPRIATAVAVLTLLAIAPRTNFSGSGFGGDDRLRYIFASGIADERAFYYQWTGLLPVLHGHRIEDIRWAREGRRLAAEGPHVVAAKSLGLVGYYAGPAVHIVDLYALCDPLLARLPSTDAWRIGHFERRLPDGYLETLATGRISLRDPGLSELYRRIVSLTRLPLWSRERFQAVLDLNVRGYDGWLAGWRSQARISQPHAATAGTLD